MGTGGLIIVFIVVGIPAIVGFSALIKLYLEHVAIENKEKSNTNEVATIQKVKYCCSSCGIMLSFHYTVNDEVKKRMFRLCRCSTSKTDYKVFNIVKS